LRWLADEMTSRMPNTMPPVARIVRRLTASPRQYLAKTAFETNCTAPSAASSDCAAKENETKFIALPTTKRSQPPLRRRQPRPRPDVAPRRAVCSSWLWPISTTFVPRLMSTLPTTLISAPSTHSEPPSLAYSTLVSSMRSSARRAARYASSMAARRVEDCYLHRIRAALI